MLHENGDDGPNSWALGRAGLNRLRKTPWNAAAKLPLSFATVSRISCLHPMPPEELLPWFLDSGG
jgi:hypothetical protein